MFVFVIGKHYNFGLISLKMTFKFLNTRAMNTEFHIYKKYLVEILGIDKNKEMHIYHRIVS